MAYSILGITYFDDLLSQPSILVLGFQGAISDMHQAIDVLGFPNPGCSKGVFDKNSLAASLNLDLR